MHMTVQPGPTNMLPQFFCKSAEEIPTERHWVIITTDQIFEYDGWDEKNPFKRNVVQYNAFMNQKDWIEQIKKLTLAQKACTAFEANPVPIHVEVNVVIDTKV